MVKRKYIPSQGDLVWFDFSPYKGHEQGGRRPALVLTPQTYNERTGLALMCPITSRKKGYATEIRLSDDAPIAGVILGDQARSQDWSERKTDFIAHIDGATYDEVTKLINKLIKRLEQQ